MIINCIPYNQSSFDSILYFRSQMIDVSLLHNNTSTLQYTHTKFWACTSFKWSGKFSLL